MQRGGIVAFPTESSYGLAVDIRNEAALHRLYKVKARPPVKPLLILISDRDMILAGRLAASFPEEYKPLAARFWPGALTLVFPAHPSLSTTVTAGSATIGIRISPHTIASALATQYNQAITATSANFSGAAPCRTADEVREMFGDTIDYIIDGGTADGAPSTVVGLEQGRLRVIRQGQVVLDCLRENCGV